jgi:hypothetical protein
MDESLARPFPRTSARLPGLETVGSGGGSPAPSLPVDVRNPLRDLLRPPEALADPKAMAGAVGVEPGTAEALLRRFREEPVATGSPVPLGDDPARAAPGRILASWLEVVVPIPPDQVVEHTTVVEGEPEVEPTAIVDE